jgi:pilus assembly protein FimV
MGYQQSHIPARLTLSAVAALCLSVCMPTAHALSLGRLNVQSLMGEPLRAEMEVTQFTPEELRSLTSTVASPANFVQAGMEYHSGLAGVKSNIEKRADGSTFVVLTGSTPILDTFVDLILDTRWSTGKVTKNYALLLTASNNNQVPPTTPRNAQTATPNSNLPSIPQPSGMSSKNVPVYRFEPLDSPAVPTQNTTSTAPPMDPAPAVSATPLPIFVEKAPATEPKTRPLPPAGTVTVAPGNTATQLVMQHLPANVSVDQMLVALIQANPHAFINSNVNLIRAGSSLRIPSAEEATQVDASEARQTLVAQSRDFGAYARKMASTPIQVGTEESGSKMSGRVSTQVKDSTPDGPVQDKLTLTKHDDNKKGSESQIVNEKKAKDEADQLEVLTKNIEALKKLQTPETVQPASPTAAPVAVTPDSKPEQSLIERLTSAPNAMAWAAGLLALMLGLAVYLFRRNSDKGNFVSSHPEYPSAEDKAPHTRVEPPPHTGFNPEIAALDLNLDATAADESGAKKLNLAEQLIAKGDADLARSLLTSLVSSPNTSLKSRALQLLEQLK